MNNIIYESKPIESYENIKLLFGKHKDKTIKEIADNDMKYVEWLLPKMKTDTPTGKAMHKYFTSRMVNKV